MQLSEVIQSAVQLQSCDFLSKNCSSSFDSVTHPQLERSGPLQMFMNHTKLYTLSYMTSEHL